VGRAAVFQQIDGAHQVVFQQLPGAGFSVASCQNAGLRRGVDHPVHQRKRFQVAGHADVAVEQLHTQALQGKPVGLAALPGQVVDANHCQAFVRFHQRTCKVTACESTDT